jgi:hypothetical protein
MTILTRNEKKLSKVAHEKERSSYSFYCFRFSPQLDQNFHRPTRSHPEFASFAEYWKARLGQSDRVHIFSRSRPNDHEIESVSKQFCSIEAQLISFIDSVPAIGLSVRGKGCSNQILDRYDEYTWVRGELGPNRMGSDGYPQCVIGRI